MTKEIWRDVPEYEGYYQVSNKGKVRSLDREVLGRAGKPNRIKGQLLKHYLDKDGYERLKLNKKGKRKGFAIHRLVGMAFLVKGEGRDQINHKDGVKDNNNAENLEWVTHKENKKHAAENGLVPDQWGEKNGSAKLTEEDVHLVRKLWKEGKTAKRVSEIVGTTRSNVNNIIYGYTWKWLK